MFPFEERNPADLDNAGVGVLGQTASTSCAPETPPAERCEATRRTSRSTSPLVPAIFVFAMYLTDRDAVRLVELPPWLGQPALVLMSV
jgi:hypothetical protein